MEFSTFIVVFLVGFTAQILDGALGMGYGVMSSSFLLLTGTPPVLASSSVVLSKVFTNGASALSHLRFGNVERRYITRLLPFGVVGGIIGVLTLTSLPPGVAQPLVAIYLMLAGLSILRKGLQKNRPTPSSDEQVSKMGLIGAVGGFVDAIGGGGWGPVVTSTLIQRGINPRHAIGSSAAAEFFVALTTSAAFLTRLNTQFRLEIVLGLILGGVIAAPIAAYICGRVPAQRLMVGVGALIVLISLMQIF